MTSAQIGMRAMAFGPIDFIALEFPDNQINGETMSDLTELVSREVIRILDLILVKKDLDGEVVIQEINELDPATLLLFEPLKIEISGLITVDDISLAVEKLRNNTTTTLMLFENLWAVQLKQDITLAGGRLVLHEHLPKEVIDEALRDLADYE